MMVMAVNGILTWFHSLHPGFYKKKQQVWLRKADGKQAQWTHLLKQPLAIKNAGFSRLRVEINDFSYRISTTSHCQLSNILHGCKAKRFS